MADKYGITLVDAKALQSWQDSIEKKQEQLKLDWQKWVENANAKIAEDRKTTAKMREHNMLHTKVVEGYLKALNKLVAKLGKR